jgi:hypothetical protein
MNLLIKLTVAALAIATLAGCASIPQAPKNAQEMAALGDDNLLNVPVDITGFSWKKQEIVAVNGDKGIVTVFTDPKTGLTYDRDGQPVNAKAERVLKNGYVCEAKAIIGNGRLFEKGASWSISKINEYCAVSYQFTHNNKSLARGMATAFLVGATAGAAGVAVSGGSVAGVTATSIGINNAVSNTLNMDEDTL